MKNYTLIKHFDPNAIAIDKNGNIWVAGVVIGEIAEIKSARMVRNIFHILVRNIHNKIKII